MRFFVISISSERRPLPRFTFLYDCAGCGLSEFVTVGLGAAGIELFDCHGPLLPPKPLRSKLCLVATGGGKVSISCGYCRSAKTVITISRGPAGISCSHENSSAEKCTHDPNTCNVGFCEFPKCNFKSCDDDTLVSEPVKPVHFCGGTCQDCQNRKMVNRTTFGSLV